ncbi:hypothetical protein DFQ30_002864 [Apophysomyces sp. BC1015]|nr:hypothetical protein DFQ30_002864 [Apophysomyces sp. BC1015]
MSYISASDVAMTQSVMGTMRLTSMEGEGFWPMRLYERISGISGSKAYYQTLLDIAMTYEEWAEAATILDDLEGFRETDEDPSLISNPKTGQTGFDEWKRNPVSDEYDWELVQTRLEQLRSIRLANQGQVAMIFALRTSLARNLGDMNKSTLYSYTRIGTKTLISDYIDEAVKQLNWICDEPSEEFDFHQKHELFMNLRQSFGRTALLLSGGGTLGLHHMGVIRCLHNAHLLPRILSGASSGAIMAALVGTRTNEEIHQLFEDPSAIKLDVFEREGQPDSPFAKLHRLLTRSQLYDTNVLMDALRSNIGDLTFQEAFNRTRWILNITVSSSTLYDMPRLLNYLTAPDVLIWSAVVVSCSVPVFYGSSPLYMKDKNGQAVPWNPAGLLSKYQLYIDGSVENDLPMKKISELFYVNHFIVCQVNPHVMPFLQKSNKPPSCLRRTANFCMHMAKTELQHRCTQLRELGVMPSMLNMVQSVLSQKYSGDITIVPDIGYTQFLKLLSNPTPEFCLNAVIAGEKATWKKMSIIKNHLQIELTIDAILYRLRLRRLGEVSYGTSRPGLESRSVSELALQQPIPEGTKSLTLQDRERKATKRGLLMTAPDP